MSLTYIMIGMKVFAYIKKICIVKKSTFISLEEGFLLQHANNVTRSV